MAGEGELCRLECRGSFYVLTLMGNGEHRINPPLVDSILACLATLPPSSASAAALITTNHGKFFSNGLDLAYPSRSAVLSKSDELLEAFLRLPMPTIAAVCGHASAGGFIFALAHDHILMRKDRGFLYMSEIDVQILIPPGPMNLIRFKMPPRAFRDTVLCGTKHTAEMALAAGIIDSVHEDSESTVEAASKLAQKLAARNWSPSLYRDMRAAMYPKAFEEFNRSAEHSNLSAASKL